MLNGVGASFGEVSNGSHLTLSQSQDSNTASVSLQGMGTTAEITQTGMQNTVTAISH